MAISGWVGIIGFPTVANSKQQRATRIVNIINVIVRATRSIARLGLLEICIDLILLSLRLRLCIVSCHQWNNDKKPATIPTALVNVATGLLVHNPRIPCEWLPYYSKGATEFTTLLIPYRCCTGNYKLNWSCHRMAGGTWGMSPALSGMSLALHRG
ncbi:hypothetical protein SUGI_0510950 [Cryptomeria japonica]|nr:hypothetical protein SUGI_0510950 [Cryptomeria japonica]